MKFPSIIYTSYAIFIFILLCLIFVPTLVILSHRKSWHKVALRVHTIWSQTYFKIVFIKVEVDRKVKLDPKQQYILCANHFSYLDIPAVLLISHPKFIGKSSLGQIPVFGYFYRKIHITVNRSSVRSRAESLKLTKQALDEKYNVGFFPEGGVKVQEENLPEMVTFRNGAFILSVEKNVPILPVSMPFNYRIFPDKTPIRVHRHRCKIVIHEPLFPKENSEDEMKRLRDKTYRIIQDELNAHHSDKVPSVK